MARARPVPHRLETTRAAGALLALAAAGLLTACPGECRERGSGTSAPLQGQALGDICRETSDCAAGLACVPIGTAMCTKPCDATSPCPAGAVCTSRVEGTAYCEPACASDADCLGRSAAGACVVEGDGQGRCVITRCIDSGDCAPGFRCVDADACASAHAREGWCQRM